jgi:hypothetical protein
VTTNCFHRFLGLEKGVVREVLGRKEGFDCFKIRHVLGDDSGFVFGVAELKVALCHIFSIAFATELGWYLPLV